MIYGKDEASVAICVKLVGIMLHTNRTFGLGIASSIK